MRGIAFFDFDGTLTRHDTFVSFARHVKGARGLLRAMLGCAPSLLAWKLGLAEGAVAKQRLFASLYRGMELERFRAYAEMFADRVDADLRPEAMQLLQAHLRQGHRVVVVSASLEEWIRPWAARHGVHDVLATRAETDAGGRLTGRFSTPDCRGAEKVRRVRALIPDVESRETWAYGDSRGDEEMLALATHPFRV